MNNTTHTSQKYNVVGVGHALVDVLSYSSDSVLQKHGLIKGTMHLVDAEQVRTLCSALPITQKSSGGSAANTIVGIAQLGGQVGFIGHWANDDLGYVFATELDKENVTYNISYAHTPTDANASITTGCSFILVTSDGERTMQTHLGCSQAIILNAADEHMIATAEWIYIEGYLLDSPSGQKVIETVLSICRKTGGKSVMSLSDPTCVARHRIILQHFITQGSLSLVIGNANEVNALVPSAFSLDEAVAEILPYVPRLVATLSEKGALLFDKNQRYYIDALSTNVVDTTGAGDLFSAGLLWALSQGYDFANAGRVGCAMAAFVVGQMGARLERNDLSCRLSGLGIL